MKYTIYFPILFTSIYQNSLLNIIKIFYYYHKQTYYSNFPLWGRVYRLI